MATFSLLDTEEIRDIRERLQDDAPLSLDDQDKLRLFIDNLNLVLMESGELLLTVFPTVSKTHQKKIMDCLEKLSAMTITSIH